MKKTETGEGEIRRHRNIVSLQDKENFVGFDMLSHLRNNCLTNTSFVAFWKIKGKSGTLELKGARNAILDMKYMPQIERICILTTNGIFLVNPVTGKVEENLANKQHRFLGSYCFTESELIVFGAPDDRSRDKYILAVLDLSTTAYNAVEFKQFISQLYAPKEGELYAVIDGTSIYKVSQQMKNYSKIDARFQLNSEGPIKICGLWQDGSLIISYPASGVKEFSYCLSWGQKAIELKCDNLKAFRVGEYLWTFSDESLKMFDIDGKLYCEHHLPKKALSVISRDDGVCVFYSGEAIDRFDNYGNKIETMNIKL